MLARLSDFDRPFVIRAIRTAARMPTGEAHPLPYDFYPELELHWSALDEMALALRILGGHSGDA